MVNIAEKEFVQKFKKLSPQNQRYLICIQEALAFAQNQEMEKSENNAFEGQRPVG